MPRDGEPVQVREGPRAYALASVPCLLLFCVVTQVGSTLPKAIIRRAVMLGMKK
jgi:hypothetical protein